MELADHITNLKASTVDNDCGLGNVKSAIGNYNDVTNQSVRMAGAALRDNREYRDDPAGPRRPARRQATRETPQSPGFPVPRTPPALPPGPRAVRAPQWTRIPRRFRQARKLCHRADTSVRPAPAGGETARTRQRGTHARVPLWPSPARRVRYQPLPGR